MEQQNTTNKKMLQSLIGKLNFITNCVRPGRIFLSQLIDEMKNISNNQVKDLDPETKKRHTVQRQKKTYSGWMHFLPKFQGTLIMWLQDCMQVNKWFTTDASLVGGGGTCHGEYFHVRFTEEVLCQVNHIAQLEILTIPDCHQKTERCATWQSCAHIIRQSVLLLQQLMQEGAGIASCYNVSVKLPGSVLNTKYSYKNELHKKC